MGNVIVTEVKALALRHRLFDRLQNRADICAPDNLAPALTKRTPQFLVAGLDYDVEPGSSGWPVPTGGRYPKLCFSPVVQSMANGPLTDLGVYILPTSESMFEDYVAEITGIPHANDEELYRLYRITPGELFQSCREMRQQAPHAWALLVSNEFALAKQAWPELGKAVAGSSFKHPLIHGFMLIAEFERASLIMRHLARASQAFDRPRLIEALSSDQPLSTMFEEWELVEVVRWLSYASLSKKALWDLLFDRSVEQILALPDGHSPWALAQGNLPSNTDTAFLDATIRRMLTEAFSIPPLPDEEVERRKPMLRNDVAPRWYAMTNAVMPALALDGARDAFPARKARPFAPGRPAILAVQAMATLASAMREKWDPISHCEIAGSSEEYLATANAKLADTDKKDPTLERNLKLGLGKALIYLPSRGRMGSAARFNPRLWSELDSDRELWTMLSPVSKKRSVRRLMRREQVLVSKMVQMLLRVFEPLFKRSQHSELAVRIACDLATAISPISANPQIAQAIATLDADIKTKRRLGVIPNRGGFNRK